MIEMIQQGGDKDDAKELVAKGVNLLRYLERERIQNMPQGFQVLPEIGGGTLGKGVGYYE